MGELNSVYLPMGKDGDSDAHRGFGFVEFTLEDSVQYCICMFIFSFFFFFFFFFFVIRFSLKLHVFKSHRKQLNLKEKNFILDYKHLCASTAWLHTEQA